MYFDAFPMPYAAGAYSLMDGTYQGTHLDPFLKLKFGWLRPKVILKSGTYMLPDIETRHAVWILMNPTRALDEYFIVENRWPGTSYDRAVPQPGGGLGVWHIMENPLVYGTVGPPPGVSAAKWADVAADEWARRGVRVDSPSLRSRHRRHSGAVGRRTLRDRIRPRVERPKRRPRHASLGGRDTERIRATFHPHRLAGRDGRYRGAVLTYDSVAVAPHGVLGWKCGVLSHLAPFCSRGDNK